MGFASAYLEQKTISIKLFADKPSENTGIIIIIPAFDEDGIIYTLESLNSCQIPACDTEVIIVLNAPLTATEEQINRNMQTEKGLHQWKEMKHNIFFNLLIHNTGHVKDRNWGVGMARKMAMDEAVRRFNELNRPSGSIVSLDADCTVSKNYLLRIYENLNQRKKNNACSVYFEHPVSFEARDEIHEAVAQYELHLRYYYQALIYTGFPWVFHTIGSALAVKAVAYAKAGGMNKRQGGEDFYFIQKLIPAGGFFYLNTATVYPGVRISHRVPFGTGPVIGKMLMKGSQEFLSYDPSAFIYLKSLFDAVSLLYDAGEEEQKKIFEDFHGSLQQYLSDNNWESKLSEIRDNTSSLSSFRKRFFSWFNMFRVVKFLNFCHAGVYLDKIPVNMASRQILELLGFADKIAERDLLTVFRQMEK